MPDPNVPTLPYRASRRPAAGFVILDANHVPIAKVYRSLGPVAEAALAEFIAQACNAQQAGVAAGPRQPDRTEPPPALAGETPAPQNTREDRP